MDGIFVPIFGFAVSGALGLVCLVKRRLRPYLLSALVAPFSTSIVFLLGGFVLADMNPAREYGSAYIPTGREHDPTRVDYFLWLAAASATFLMSAIAAYWIQRVVTQVLRDRAACGIPVGSPRTRK